MLTVERQLQSLGVNFIKDEVRAFQQQDERLFATMQNGQQLLLCDKDYVLVNAANRPVSFRNLPNNHAGKLYSVSEKSSESAVALYGSGANLFWTCRDFFRKRPLVHLVLPNDRRCDDLNQYLLYKILMDDTALITRENGEVVIYGLDLLSGERVMFNVPEDNVYSALGQEHNFAIVESLPSEKVINVNCGPKEIVSAIKNSINDIKKIPLTSIGLVGTTVPPGSLTFSFGRIKSEIGLFDLSDPKSLFAFDDWKQALIEKALEQGIEIREEYFIVLKEQIRHHSVKNPMPEQFSRVVKRIYLDLDFPATRIVDNSKVTLKEFMDFLSWNVPGLDGEQDVDNISTPSAGH